MVKELPTLGYLYNNVCNDVTCATHIFAGLPVNKRSGLFPSFPARFHSYNCLSGIFLFLT